MPTYEQFADTIRFEIGKVKDRAMRCGWKPSDMAWHRAFGEISGMYRLLEIVDPKPWEPHGDPEKIMRSIVNT